MNYFILILMLVDLVFVLLSLLVMTHKKESIANSKALAIYHFMTKLTVLLPSFCYIWLLYGYLYNIVYTLNDRVYFGVVAFYIFYLIFMGLYLYVQKNQRKLNMAVVGVLTFVNLYATYYIIKYSYMVEKFLPKTNTHHVYGLGLTMGHVFMIALGILSILGFVVGYVYGHYNRYELTN